MKVAQRDYRNEALVKMLILGLLLVVGLTVSQDFIHSRINGYSFYFFESLLFKAFWIFFPPFVFFQFTFLQKASVKKLTHLAALILIPAAAHLLLVPLIIWLFSQLFFSHTYTYSGTLTYTIAEDSYKLLTVYGLSLAVYKLLFDKQVVAEQSVGATEILKAPSGKLLEPTKVQSACLERIVVASGRKYVSIAVSDILYFSAATPYISIQLENKAYLHSESLKSIGEKLNKSQFVRVHKSTIVNIYKVISYKSRLNGDCDLLLENGSEVRLSRNYGGEFKRLFGNRSPVK